MKRIRTWSKEDQVRTIDSLISALTSVKERIQDNEIELLGGQGEHLVNLPFIGYESLDFSFDLHWRAVPENE